MSWALAVVTLVVVGYVVRRVLRLDEPPRHPPGLVPLPNRLEQIYRPVSWDVETQITSLAVSLNEALGQKNIGNQENAWRLVRLALCQWERLAQSTSVLLSVISDYFPQAHSFGAIRELDATQFRSHPMIDFMSRDAVVHQVIVRSTSRYQSHIRVVRQAMDILTTEFRSSCESADEPLATSNDAWARIDPSFHDFDLVNKQALLAFRALLPALPPGVLAQLVDELSQKAAGRNGAPKIPTSSNRK